MCVYALCELPNSIDNTPQQKDYLWNVLGTFLLATVSSSLDPSLPLLASSSKFRLFHLFLQRGTQQQYPFTLSFIFDSNF